MTIALTHRKILLTKFLPVSLVVMLSLNAMTCNDSGSQLNLESDEFPEITFDQKTIDFGDIPQGADGRRNITFFNSGNAPLVMQSVRSSCSCVTVRKWSKDTIFEGKIAILEVQFDTRTVFRINKSISIYANTKENPTIVRIHGNIVDTSTVKEKLNNPGQ